MSSREALVLRGDEQVPLRPWLIPEETDWHVVKLQHVRQPLGAVVVLHVIVRLVIPDPHLGGQVMRATQLPTCAAEGPKVEALHVRLDEPERDVFRDAVISGPKEWCVQACIESSRNTLRTTALTRRGPLTFSVSLLTLTIGLSQEVTRPPLSKRLGPEFLSDAATPNEKRQLKNFVCVYKT